MLRCLFVSIMIFLFFYICFFNFSDLYKSMCIHIFIYLFILCSDVIQSAAMSRNGPMMMRSQRSNTSHQTCGILFLFLFLFYFYSFFIIILLKPTPSPLLGTPTPLSKVLRPLSQVPFSPLQPLPRYHKPLAGLFRYWSMYIYRCIFMYA